jgi:hypothetical protein
VGVVGDFGGDDELVFGDDGLGVIALHEPGLDRLSAMKRGTCRVASD